MNELRFAFGQNWSDFVEKKLGEAAIGQSVQHMAGFLRKESLKGKTFLDIGCGSGIHSLAALRLGADRVVSFDYDDNSVATAERVRTWAEISEQRWNIHQGSVLDTAFMQSFGQFDVVYSWGVLHHTGAMWEAVRKAALPLKPGGDFYIALYSSDNYVDPPPEFWIRVKRAYNQADSMTRKLMELKYVNRFVVRAGALSHIANYGLRGMSFWTDVRDWLGGYPMEFAGFRETMEFCKAKLGLDLVNAKTGEGCTEYLFTYLGESARWREVEAARVRYPMHGTFKALKGAAFAFPAPQLAAFADNSSAPARSRIMIYEDGKPLGLAHSSLNDIFAYGGGRFTHWIDRIVFSASDNSDPNRNGRTYTYCELY